MLWVLMGLGSQWAQDPPAYARVEQFATLGGLDVSRTVLDDWQGWDHARTIYFFPGGPVFIVDEAQSRSGRGQAAVTWHLAGEGELTSDGLRLRSTLCLRTGQAACAAVAGSQGWVRLAWPSEAHQDIEAHRTTLPDGLPGWDVIYYTAGRGRLDLTTAYLGPAWVGAKTEFKQVAGDSGLPSAQAHRLGTGIAEHQLGVGGTPQGSGWLLDVNGPAGRQQVLHNPTSGRLEAAGLSSDGLAVSLRQSEEEGMQICYVGGSEVRVALQNPPAEVAGNGVRWAWQDGMLVLQPDQADSAGCVELKE